MPGDIETGFTGPQLKGGSNNSETCQNAGLITCGVTFFSGLASASSAAAGATGAAILKSAGHAAYNVQNAAAAGAAGGAVAAIPVGIVLACCTGLFGEEESSDKSKNNKIGQFLLSAGISALSGALGYAMIYSGSVDSEMNAGQFAAATAVGSAVLNGGVAVLSAICGR